MCSQLLTNVNVQIGPFTLFSQEIVQRVTGREMQSWNGLRPGLMGLGYQRVLWIHVRWPADSLSPCQD